MDHTSTRLLSPGRTRLAHVVSLCMGIALALPVLGAKFEKDYMTSGGKEETILDCTSIDGTLGLLEDWGDSDESSTRYETDNGHVGTLWTGSQYEECTALPAPAVKQSWLVHTWKRKNSGPCQLTVTLDSEVKESGSAEIHPDRDTNGDGDIDEEDEQDPSWWWDPFTELSDKHPIISKHDRDGNQFGTIGLDCSDSWDEIWVRGTGGKGESNPPEEGELLTPGHQILGDLNDSGTMEGMAIVPNDNRIAKLKVTYEIKTHGNRHSDNVKVDDWKVYLKSTMTSRIH